MLDKKLARWLFPAIISVACSALLYVTTKDLATAVISLVSLSSTFYGIFLADYLPINTENENMYLILRVGFPLTLMSISTILAIFIVFNSIALIATILPYIALSFVLSLALTFVYNKLF